MTIESFADAHALAAELRAVDPSATQDPPVEAADLAALDLLQRLASATLDRLVEERDPELLRRVVRRLIDHFGEPRGHKLLSRLAGELGLESSPEPSTERRAEATRDHTPADHTPAPDDADASACVRELLLLALLARHGGARRVLRRLGIDAEGDAELAETLAVAGEALHEVPGQPEPGGGAVDNLERLAHLVEVETADETGFDGVLGAILREPDVSWSGDPRRIEAVLGLIAESRAPRFAPGHAPEPEIGLGEDLGHGDEGHGDGDGEHGDRGHGDGGHRDGESTGGASLGAADLSATPTAGPGEAGWEIGDGAMSPDADWMPDVVLLAKNAIVWLDQLSRGHGRLIERLDEIPREVFEEIAWRGFNALWLVGIWERSEASARIKREQGQTDAAPSAYSVRRYRVAPELGGEEALERLSERAARCGIRLAADFVPNHTAIDSDWVLRHPDRFLSLEKPPFPGYSFTGVDLSPVVRFRLRIEDHYLDHSDAAVVFERTDRKTGETRYIYHGNDGTATPWNDTAQLDYLKAKTREAVIETIVEVARRFPIVRLDAAMTLARRHLHRLWYPSPEHAGAVPSRAEHGLSEEAFAERVPREIWLDVVERLREEAPDTLLLAEAFWLMEGYFVRKLGLHRVYNSAFMHMLRDGKTSKLRRLIADMLTVDRAMLGRFVNYLSNPDEAPAIAQFGAGDRYFGACRLLATLPGLPLFAHGQWEGFAEQYGMEFLRARTDERPDRAVIERHDREVAPLLARRTLFSGVESFRLLELVDGSGSAVDRVLAFVNRSGGEGVVVAFNNAPDRVAGRLREPDGAKSSEGEGRHWLDLLGASDGVHRLQDLAGPRRLDFAPEEAKREGLTLELEPYECAVLVREGAAVRA